MADSTREVADSTREDETRDEREEAQETGASPDEAHRIGEFDELRGLMESIRDEISGLRSTIADMMATKPGDERDAPDEGTPEDERELIDIDELDL